MTLCRADKSSIVELAAGTVERRDTLIAASGRHHGFGGPKLYS